MDTSILLALKVAASTGIGLLIGLEREWAHKEAGVRSFTIAALLGTLAWLVAPILAFVQLSVVLVIIILVNVYALRKDQDLEITTSIALAATNVLGIVVGMGSFFLAFTCAIVIAALLSWKTEFLSFTRSLTIAEIRGTLLLGFITAVVYPLLPDYPVDPWHVLTPRSVWLTVVLVSAVSFVNYVLLRQFGERGRRYSALLGGLVNSAAMMILLGQEVRDDEEAEREVLVNSLLADTAMILRNWGLVALFALPQDFPASLPTIIVLLPMMVVAGGLAIIIMLRTATPPSNTSSKPPLVSPLALRSVLRFGILFLALTVISGLANHFFGTIGFLVVVVVGALASAASSAVLVGQQVASNHVGTLPAALAMFLATLMGLGENVVILWVTTRKPGLGLRLLGYTVPIIVVGGILLTLVFVFQW
jgi:uncharacterized membrane protein (DUF4010 family)